MVIDIDRLLNNFTLVDVILAPIHAKFKQFQYA